MQRLLITLGILSGSVLAFASNPPAAKPCPSALMQFYDPETLFSTNQLNSFIETFSTSPTIQALQRMQIERSQKEFNPVLILKNADAKELLVYGFPEVFYISKNPQELPNYHGIRAFFDQWESDFKKTDGFISAEWQSSRETKKKFFQTLVLEIAYGYQRAPETSAAQPVNFIRQKDKTYSLLAGSAEIIDIFGSVEAFKSAFIDFKRKKDEQRTPFFTTVSTKPNPRTKAAKDFKNLLNENPPQISHPHREEDRKLRGQEEWVDLGVEQIKKHQEKRNPLARLVMSSSRDENPFELALKEYERLVELFQGFPNYVDALNFKLPYKLQICMDRRIKTWTEELMVQLAYEYVILTTSDNADFTGFQTEDRDAPYYIVTTNRAFLDSKLNIKQLNEHVRLRKRTLQ